MSTPSDLARDAVDFYRSLIASQLVPEGVALALTQAYVQNRLVIEATTASIQPRKEPWQE